jgi:hypothetical protein
VRIGRPYNEPMTRSGLVLIMLAGCGLTMTRGPGPQTAQRPVCTETMAAPKRDGVGAVLGLLTVVVGGLLLESNDPDNESIGGPVLVGGLVVMAASYASGGIGYYRVKRCRKAIAEFERR